LRDGNGWAGAGIEPSGGLSIVTALARELLDAHAR
jgi:hypothetical protein